ncbi:MAG: polysaccharide biosynthesis/export family protein [Bacteroidales bacterium]|nr:polysaccharide biosynthesis/export family protein [Bacteroidales bacterium]
MKMLKRILPILLVACLASCTSYKSVPYMQNVDAVTLEQKPLYDAKIMPKDLLTITVNCTDPEVALPFNLTIQTAFSVNNKSTYSSPSLMTYLVDNEGSIDFPVLGRLKVGGLTKTEAENMIREGLKPYINEVPIVTVRMANYKISVLGEVARPGTFTVSNEKVNIFEALALAGDMTVWGVRNDVKLIREDANGERMVASLNLNDANIINSDYYYLQQNDVVYVTPNKVKARNSDIGSATSLWFTAGSMLVSIASLLVNILM